MTTPKTPARLDADRTATAAFHSHDPDDDYPRPPQALSVDERAGVLRCLEWLKTRADEIEGKVDDANAACANLDRAEAALLLGAARDMAAAFGVEWKR